MYVGVMTDYAACPPSSQDYVKKDGAMVALASISKILMEKKSFATQLEEFMINFIIPEFHVRITLSCYIHLPIVKY
jgi:hypothetical protein